MDGKYATEGIINPEEILTRFFGDCEGARQVMRVFLAESPNAMAHLREAIRDKDAEKICTSAHSFKGAASTFSARVAGCASTLEQMGSSGSLQGVEEVMERLEQEVRKLESALIDFMAEDAVIEKTGV